ATPAGGPDSEACSSSTGDARTVPYRHDGKRRIVSHAPALGSSAKCLRALARLDGGACNCREMGAHRASERRQRNAVMCPPEQRAAEGRFQLLQALADRRLAHAAASGGAGEISFAGCGEKVPDLRR